MALRSLKLEEFSDREFLHIVHDLAGTNGGVTSGEIADRLNLDHEQPTRCVGSRLAWLKRFGAVAQDDERHWSLTAMGERYALGRLTLAEQHAVERMSSDVMVDLMRVVASRYRKLAPTGSHLVRREWLYGSKR